METTKITAESVLQHHLEALGNNDLDELMKDYTEYSELWTPDGDIIGLQAISSFFPMSLPFSRKAIQHWN